MQGDNEVLALIEKFVRAYRLRGYSFEQIESMLLQRGYSQENIKTGMYQVVTETDHIPLRSSLPKDTAHEIGAPEPINRLHEIEHPYPSQKPLPTTPQVQQPTPPPQMEQPKPEPAQRPTPQPVSPTPVEPRRDPNKDSFSISKKTVWITALIIVVLVLITASSFLAYFVMTDKLSLTAVTNDETVGDSELQGTEEEQDEPPVPVAREENNEPEPPPAVPEADLVDDTNDQEPVFDDFEPPLGDTNDDIDDQNDDVDDNDTQNYTNETLEGLNFTINDSTLLDFLLAN